MSNTHLAIGAIALVTTEDGAERIGSVYCWLDDQSEITVMLPGRRLETFPRDQVQVRW